MSSSIRFMVLSLAALFFSACGDDGTEDHGGAVSICGDECKRPDETGSNTGSGRVGVSDAPNDSAAEPTRNGPPPLASAAGNGGAGRGADAGLPIPPLAGTGTAGIPGGIPLSGTGAVGGSGPTAGFGAR